MNPLPIPEGSGRDVDTEDDAEGDPCRDTGGHEAIPGSQCLRGHQCGSRTSLGDAPGVRQNRAPDTAQFVKRPERLGGQGDHQPSPEPLNF